LRASAAAAFSTFAATLAGMNVMIDCSDMLVV
jgi:hypothetical protein